MSDPNDRIMFTKGAKESMLKYISWDSTHLVMMCSVGSMSGALELIELGASVTARASNGGPTPLVAACNGGHADIARMLIEHGASVTEKHGARGLTALHIACSVGRIDTSPVLEMRGASKSPVHVACNGGHIDTAQMLLEHGASLTEKTTTDGTTPLHLACQCGHINLALFLVEKGSNLTDQDNYGNRPEDVALMHGHSDLAAMLKEKFVCAGIECQEPPNSQCSRCLRVFYCSKECQVADWRRHKKSCGKNKKRCVKKA